MRVVRSIAPDDWGPSSVDGVRSHGSTGGAERVAVDVWVAWGDNPTLRGAQTSAGARQRAMGRWVPWTAGAKGAAVDARMEEVEPWACVGGGRPYSPGAIPVNQ